MSHLHFPWLLIKLTANDWFNNRFALSFFLFSLRCCVSLLVLLLLLQFIHLLNPFIFTMFCFAFILLANPWDFDCFECNLQTTIMRCTHIRAKPIAKVVQWEQQFLKINFLIILYGYWCCFVVVLVHFHFICSFIFHTLAHSHSFIQMLLSKIEVNAVK